MRKILTPSLVRFPGSFKEKAEAMNFIQCERTHVDVTVGGNIAGLFRYNDFDLSVRSLFKGAIDLHIFDFRKDWQDWENMQLPINNNDCAILHIFPYMDLKLIYGALSGLVEKQVKIGLALDVECPLNILKNHMCLIDVAVIMGIEVGGSRLPLNEKAIDGLMEIKSYSGLQEKPIRLGIDGGVNVKTFEPLARVADFIVIGSILFDAPDLTSQWKTLNNWLMGVNGCEK